MRTLRVVFLAALCSGVQPALLPEPVWVRLQTPVTSLRGPEPVEAVAIPAGFRLKGHTEPVDRRRLRIRFDALERESGSLPITARVIDVDNAREKVLNDGVIVALEPLRKRPGKVELVLLAAAHAHPATLAFVEGTKLGLRELDRPSVHYPAGVDLLVRFDAAPPGAVLPSRTEHVEAPPPPVARFADTLPDRVATYQTRKPADWINFAFAGSKEDLIRGFENAGWKRAEDLSLRAGVKTFLALAEHHSYQHAPVSRLELFGRLPDLVYQKQNNTFAKRHHIRIWEAERRWNGRPLWLAAATHDTGIEFSPSSRTFVHRIEEQIDRERQRVLDDLRLAGAVKATYAIPRRSVVQESRNATGDRVRTDGKLFWLELR